MLTYAIREDPESRAVHMFAAVDALPPHWSESFTSLEAAQAARPELDWRAPTADDECSPDVLAIAETE